MKNVKKIVSFILIFSLILTFIPMDEVLAEKNTEDSKSKAKNIERLVDSIELSSKRILDGERLTAEIVFSEKEDLRLSSGDILNLSLKTDDFPEGVSFTIYNNKASLELNGVVYGDVEVRGNDLVFVFNDKVEDLKNIKGSFKFDLQGRNINGDMNEYDEQRAILDFGLSHIDGIEVNVYRNEAGVREYFHYMGGRILTNKIGIVSYYHVINNVNRGKFESGMVVEVDIDKKNQILEEESIKIDLSKDDDRKVYSMSEFLESGLGKVELDKDTIKFYFKEDSLNNSLVSIYYETKAILRHQQEYKVKARIYKNNLEADYRIDELEDEELESIVESTNFGGHIYGSDTKGKIKARVVDRSGKGLEDAGLVLINSNTGEEIPARSDKDGYIEIDTSGGTFLLKLVAESPGYMTKEQIIFIEDLYFNKVGEVKDLGEFVSDKKIYKVNITYTDKEGNTIREPEYLEGFLSDEIKIKFDETIDEKYFFEGYEINKGLSKEDNLIFRIDGNTSNEVNIKAIYNKEDREYTVHYLSTSGKLLESKTYDRINEDEKAYLNGKVSIESLNKNIDKYTLDYIESGKREDSSKKRYKLEDDFILKKDKDENNIYFVYSPNIRKLDVVVRDSYGEVDSLKKNLNLKVGESVEIKELLEGREDLEIKNIKVDGSEEKEELEVLYISETTEENIKLDIDCKNRTLYKVEHIEYGTNKILQVDEDIDGFVNEEIKVNEDFVNVFRGYKYKKIKTLDGKIFEDEASLVLSNDLEKNKIYIVYEKIEENIGDGGKPIVPEIPEKEKPVLPEEIETLVLGEVFNIKEHIRYIEGYEDNRVRPESNITREEVAAAVYRLLDEDYRDNIEIKEHLFVDVSKNRWSNKYIKTLASNNILRGDKDGRFRPEDSITRGELAVLMARFDKLEEAKDIGFEDIDNHWAKKEIISAASKGWIKGYDGRFRPDENITRAEFVVLFNRVLGRKANIDYLPEGIKEFKDLDKEKWYYLDMVEAINSHIYDNERLEDGSEKIIKLKNIEVDM